ncbi:MAG: T9SS type A sorting domain-containing protein [Bacteroidia bacterium]|nr:T9SS type A sorting domain-containing protein [Bacteroidia bacterium]
MNLNFTTMKKITKSFMLLLASMLFLSSSVYAGGLVIDPTQSYTLSYTISNTTDLPRVYFKLFKTGQNENYLEVPAEAIPTGADVVKTNTMLPQGDLTEITTILFDFGGNPANSEIAITNVALFKEGETENLLNNIHPVETTVFFAPDWTASTNYTYVVNQGAQITLGDATYQPWQAQFGVNFEILTSVEETENSNVEIYSNDGSIFVNADAEQLISIYDVAGKLVVSETASSFSYSVNAGIYIVKVGDKTTKLNVK